MLNKQETFFVYNFLNKVFLVPQKFSREQVVSRRGEGELGMICDVKL